MTAAESRLLKARFSHGFDLRPDLSAVPSCAVHPHSPVSLASISGHSRPLHWNSTVTAKSSLAPPPPGGVRMGSPLCAGLLTCQGVIDACLASLPGTCG